MNLIVTEPLRAASIAIRAFVPADAERISRLLGEHTPYRRDAAFWLWLNRMLPVWPALIAVAEAEGEVVGHYSILPLDLRLPGGRTLRAGHGVHAFVHPAFRGRVSIFQISAHAYRIAREAGLEFVFGFPNAKYRLVQEKIERWRCVSLFKAWTKPAVVGGAAEGEGRLEAADLQDEAQLHFAVRFWEAADAASGGITVVGQARWWMIRYVLHPQRPYSCYWLIQRGERCGLVMTKLFTEEGETRAHIVDYVLAHGESPLELIRAFEAEFQGRAQRFVHWSTEPAFAAALVAAGYQPDGFETFFGIRRLDSFTSVSLGASDPLLEASTWRLPMGLSDAI